MAADFIVAFTSSSFSRYEQTKKIVASGFPGWTREPGRTTKREHHSPQGPRVPQPYFIYLT